MALFPRSTQLKARNLRSRRTTHERQKSLYKQKSSSLDICSYPNNNVQKNICTHISAKKVLPNLKKALRNKKIREEFKISKEVRMEKINKSTRTKNVSDKLNQIEPKVKEELKSSKEVEKKVIKRSTRQNVNTLIRNESEHQIEEASLKTIKNLEFIPSFTQCGISNESEEISKQECLRISSKSKTFEKQLLVESNSKDFSPLVGTEILSSSIKTRMRKYVEVHETNYLNICTLSEKEHPQGLEENSTKEVKMARFVDRDVQIPTRKRSYDKLKESLYEKNLKESNSSSQDIRYSIKRDSLNYVHTNSATKIMPELKVDLSEKILKSSRRKSRKSDAPNSLIENKTACQKFTMIEEILTEGKTATRSTRQHANAHCKNNPAGKIEENSTRRKFRNTEFTSQNICSPILGESSHELKKATGVKKLKMSKSPSPNKISKNETANKPKEIPFHKTSTILESKNKDMHTHFACEIQENLVEAQSNSNVKEYESKNSNFPVAIHRNFKKECPEESQDVPRKKKLKTESSYSPDIHTRSRSGSILQFNGCFTPISEPQTSKSPMLESTRSDSLSRTKRKYSDVKSASKIKIETLESNFEKYVSSARESLNAKLTVAESTHPDNCSRTESKYYSGVKSASKMEKETLESSYEKSVSPAKSSLNSKLTVTEFTRPHTRRSTSNSKSKHPSVVEKSASEVSMKTPESVCLNDPTNSETENLDNSSETGNEESTTSVLTDRKKVTIDRSILKEELLEALKRSVGNAVSEEPQPGSSAGTTPVFEAPSGEKFKEFEMSIRRASEKAVANVDPADCESFLLEIEYFNLIFFVAFVFNQNKEESAN